MTAQALGVSMYGTSKYAVLMAVQIQFVNPTFIDLIFSSSDLAYQFKSASLAIHDITATNSGVA